MFGDREDNISMQSSVVENLNPCRARWLSCRSTVETMGQLYGRCFVVIFGRRYYSVDDNLHNFLRTRTMSSSEECSVSGTPIFYSVVDVSGDCSTATASQILDGLMSMEYEVEVLTVTLGY